MMVIQQQIKPGMWASGLSQAGLDAKNNGLIVLLPFWDGNPKTWNTPIAQDIVGKTDMVFTNTPTWAASRFGPSILFNAANERVVATTTALPVTGCTVFQFTKTLAASSNFSTYGTDTNNGWRSFNGGTNPALWLLIVEVGGSDFGRHTGFEVEENVWTSLLFTIAPGASAHSDVKLYIDGKQKDATDNNPSNPFQPAGELWIGSRFAGLNANQQTSVFAIWDRVLSLPEIEEISEKPFALFTPTSRTPVVAAPAAFGGVSQIIGGGILSC